MKKMVLLGLILFTIGIIFVIQFNPHLQPKNFTIKLSENEQLVGQIYFPSESLKPDPTIILTHGINSSKETMNFLGLELARHGVTSVSFDFGHYGESSDFQGQETLEIMGLRETELVRSYLQEHPDLFDFNKMGIAGHSMGGSVALDFAKKYPDIKTTLLLGIGGEAQPKSPHNLFYGVGFYEELNPVTSLYENLEIATNQRIRDGVLFGDFSLGSARKLFISPTSDHFIAPYDYHLINQSIQWVLSSFNLTSPVNNIIYLWHFLGFVFIGVGGLITGISGVKYLPSQYQNKKNTALVIFPSMGIIYGLTKFDIIPPSLASNIILFLLLSQGLVNYYFYKRKTFSLALKLIIIYGLIGGFVFLIPGFLNALPVLFNHLDALLQLPLYVGNWFLFIVYNTFLQSRKQLFVYYTIDLIPSYWLFVLGLILTVFPERLVRDGEGLLLSIITQIRQPLKITTVGKVSGKTLFLMGCLSLVFALILYHQIKMGLVAEVVERGWDGLRLFLQMFLLPMGVFMVILRSPFLKKVEEHLRSNSIVQG